MKCSYMDICFLLHVNNKGADQTAHLCSLISALVFHYLESRLSKLATDKILSCLLVFVAE